MHDNIQTSVPPGQRPIDLPAHVRGTVVAQFYLELVRLTRCSGYATDDLWGMIAATPYG